MASRCIPSDSDNGAETSEMVHVAFGVVWNVWDGYKIFKSVERFKIQVQM